MKLYYCETCGIRIPATEIPADQPEPEDGKFFCAQHRPAAKQPAKPPSAFGMRPPSTAGHPAVSGQSRTRITPAPAAIGKTPAHGTRSSVPKLAPAAAASPESKRQPHAHPAAPKPGNKNMLIFGVAGGVFIVLAAIIGLSGSDKPKPAKPRETQVAADTSTRTADAAKPLPNQTSTPATPSTPTNPTNATNATNPTTPATPANPAPANPVTTPEKAPTPAVPATPISPAPDQGDGPKTTELTKAPPPVGDVNVANPLEPKPAAPDATATTPVPAANPKNLVKDGDFESGSVALWLPVNDVSICNDPAKVRTGKFCLRVGSKGTARQVVRGLKPATKYVLTGWLNGSGAVLGIKEYAKDAPELMHFNTQPGYQQISVTFTTGPRGTTAKVFVRDEKNSDTFVDDIAVVPFDAATAPEDKTPAPPDKATAPTETTAAPKPPEENPAGKLEAVQEGVITLLGQGKVDAALTTLGEAKNDAALKTVQAELDSAIAGVKGYDALVKAMPEGLKKLNDGRAFTFKVKGGRDIQVGGKSKSAVVDFKDGDIVVETKDGGIVASQKIIFDELTDQCRLELATQALPPGPDTEAKLAFAEFVLLSSGHGGTVAGVRAHVERTKKDATAAAAGEFVIKTLEMLQLNQRIDEAVKKIEAALKDNNNAQARTLYEDFKKDFGPGYPPRAKKFADEHYRDFEFLPGLWASYFAWSAGKDFERYCHSRTETKLFIDWKGGSPDASVPADYFQGKFCGFLRIEKAGDYTFQSLRTDDQIYLAIDDKKILENYNCGTVEAKVTLSAGDHPIHVIYHEVTGGATLHLRWKLDGGFDLQEIPSAVLWYDPMLKEQYQKPEK